MAMTTPPVPLGADPAASAAPGTPLALHVARRLLWRLARAAVLVPQLAVHTIVHPRTAASIDGWLVRNW